ncbi:ABC transporter permease [Clostridia bacterium]|nr:ABC transporter permease [Clostridia bacterium]
MTQFSLRQQAFLEKEMRQKQFVFFSRIFLFIFLLSLWEIAGRQKWIDVFFFSSPSRILYALLDMVKNKSLFLHVGLTMGETLLSFSIVTILTLFVALLLWSNRALAQILEPYLILCNSLPKSALAPLFIVWFGHNVKTILIAGISVAIFGSILTLYTQFKEMNDEKSKLIYTLGGNQFHVLSKVILPASVPMIFSTMKVNIGLCLVGVIIGEFLVAKAGLGYLIMYGSQVFKLDWVMLSIFLLCGIALILYKILAIAEKKL